MKNTIKNNKELKDAHIKERMEHFEKEKSLNISLIKIIERMPEVYLKGGNSFRRHKLALVLNLKQMNEFKVYFK